jgi:DNA-binding MarR family transcriptional regulator
MTMIGAYPGLSNADLARLSVLTPQTVSVIVANLLRADIVTRHQHAVHGRIQQLELTETGKTMLAHCRERVAVIERRLTADLSSSDEEVVRRWLVAVALTGDDGDSQPAA